MNKKADRPLSQSPFEKTFAHTHLLFTTLFYYSHSAKVVVSLFTVYTHYYRYLRLLVKVGNKKCWQK